MYYLYLGRQGSFQSPESIIVEFEGNYFYRGIHTDWFMMDEEEVNKMTSGRDNKYYAIEKEEFDSILNSWGGSKHGYKSMNIHGEYDHEGYGDSYDEEDDIPSVRYEDEYYG